LKGYPGESCIFSLANKRAFDLYIRILTNILTISSFAMDKLGMILTSPHDDRPTFTEDLGNAVFSLRSLTCLDVIIC
jgi:hypothetical protein